MVHVDLEYFAPSLPRECRNAFKEVGKRLVLNVMHEQPKKGAKIIVTWCDFLIFSRPAAIQLAAWVRCREGLKSLSPCGNSWAKPSFKSDD